MKKLLFILLIGIALFAGCATVQDSPEGTFFYDGKGPFEKGQWYVTDMMGNPPVPLTKDQVDLLRELPAHQRNAQIRKIFEDAYYLRKPLKP